ncbi:uncharacterized protein [Ptychodera flava]|uniref:uncharacterized protein n=1 Tax=Ptychodera flava TaxID=63121 RepID=UPI00396A9199
MVENDERLRHQLHLVDANDVANLAKDERRLQQLIDDGKVRGTLPKNRVQVQILGDARVGKTSLRKKLMGEKFDPNEGETVGIDTTTCEIQCTDVDENWRRVDSNEDDFTTCMAWFIAKNLARDVSNNEERYASIKASWGLLLYVKLILPIFVMVIIFPYIHSENMFIFLMVSFISVLTIFMDKTTAYRIGAGISLYVVALDSVYRSVGESFDDCDDFLRLFFRLIALFYFISAFGFLFGMALGAGFRTGFAIAFTGMLAQQKNASSGMSSTNDSGAGALAKLPDILYDRAMVAFGVLVGYSLHALYNKSLRKTLKHLPLFSKFKYVAISHFIMVVTFDVICSTYNSYGLYIILLFALMMIVTLIGLEFGRPFGSKLKITMNPRMWLLSVGIGMGLAYLCGWRFPNELNNKMLLAVAGCLTLLTIEFYRIKSYSVCCPVPLSEISRHSMNLRELKNDSLPVSLCVWDFAGQDFFYNTHHVFMATHAIFFIVFKLTDFLTNESRQRHVNRILFWLKSICTHADHPNSLVFLVGSHKDQVPCEAKSDIALFLKRTLYDSNSEYCKRLVINKDNTPLWTIENSTGRDEEFYSFQRALWKFALKVDDPNAHYPLRWLQFRSLMCKQQNNPDSQKTILHSLATYIVGAKRDTRSNTGYKLDSIMPINELYETVRASSDLQNREDFVKMLKFFHNSGEIIYLLEDVVLSQYVVLRPDVLIDAVKSFVSIPEEKEREPCFADLWNRLSTEGIIHQRLLEHLLKDIYPNTRVLVTFLQCFGLICPVKRITKIPYGFSVEEYIVPSMRPDYDGKTDQLGPVRPYRMFYFDFGFFRPDVILTRLMAKCLALSNHVQIFRNVGRFTKDGAFSVRLELVNHLPEQHFIKVVVALVKNLNPYTFLNRLHSYVEAIRCREFPNLKYKCGVLCEFPPPYDGCSDGDMLHILPICKQDEDFPVIGSTVIGFCNGVQQGIQLIAPIVDDNEKNHRDDEERQVGLMEIPVNEGLDPNLYDVYVICSQRDDVWVRDYLVHFLENGPCDVTVKVNAYCKETDRNINYLKRCAINIVVISRHSVRDERCSEEREFAYQHHPLANVIHIFKDKSIGTIAMKNCLTHSHVCLDYYEHKEKHEEAVFRENLLKHVKDAFQI